MLRTRVDGADAVLLIRPDGLSWAVGTIEVSAEDVVERTGLTVAELRDAVASLRLNLKASA